MKDKINSFDTFDSFYDWLETPSLQSDEQILKTQIRRESIELTRKHVEGKTLDERNKAMEDVSYEDRMRIVYEELHG
jgi:predicted GTPase